MPKKTNPKKIVQVILNPKVGNIGENNDLIVLTEEGEIYTRQNDSNGEKVWVKIEV